MCLNLLNNIISNDKTEHKLELPLPALYRGINILAEAESSNTDHTLHKPNPIFLLDAGRSDLLGASG